MKIRCSCKCKCCQSEEPLIVQEIPDWETRLRFATNALKILPEKRRDKIFDMIGLSDEEIALRINIAMSELGDWKLLRKGLKKKRWAILSRDNFTCQYCGAIAPDVKLHVDHRIPISKGGGNKDSNLVTACSDCNLGKGADFT